jgi:PKD repeat protein
MNIIPLTNKSFYPVLLLVSLALLVTAASASVLSIGNGQVTEVGSSASVNMTLDSAPDGLVGYTINVTIGDPSIAVLSDVSFPAWSTYTDNTTLPAPSVRLKAADLEEKVQAGSTNINLASITIKGLKGGTTPVTLTITSLEADTENQIPSTIQSGTFTVNVTNPSAVPVPLPGYQNAPTDPRHENLYGDLNANGRLDFNDLQLFFRYMTWMQANEPVSLFDYNHNGRLDFNDLQILFRKM